MNQRGFVIPSFLMSPTGIMGMAIVALSVSNVIFFKLWQNGVEKYAHYVSQVEAAQERIAAENAAKVSAAEAATRDVSLAWDRALGDLRAGYTSRLRGQDRRCAAVSGASATSRLVNESTANTGSGTSAFEATCTQLESDCAHTTGQLIFLQDWARRVCK